MKDIYMNDREKILKCRVEREMKVVCSMTETTCNSKSHMLTIAHLTFDWLIS
jgi:hypothetical protein